MRTFLLAAAIGSSIALTVAGVASAQNTRACTQRDAALNHLSQKYSESPIAIGLTSNGGVIEVLTAPSGKTWTIVITMPSGLTCMIASGEEWEAIDQITGGPAT